LKADTYSLESVHARFLETANQYADNAFLHIPRQATHSYSETAVDFNYEEMRVAIDKAQAVYKQAGYAHGHRIALALENRAEFFQHFFALNGLGVCVAPINAEFVVEEISYLIDDSDVSLVVALPEHLSKLSKALDSIQREVDLLSLDNLNALPSAPKVDNTNIRKGEQADAAILYTSGTTGKPKGCVLSNEFFFCVGDWYTGIGGYCSIEAGMDRIITPLPVFHTNALVWSMMAMLQSGGCIIQLDRFHSSNWWETARESKATIMHYLGVMPAMLLNLPESDEDVQSQIKFGLGGGVEPDLHARFEQRFGLPLIEGWAMTETGSGVCFMSQNEPRIVGNRCMGRVTKDMEIRIIGNEGEDVTTGTAGEMLVRRLGSNPAYGFFTEYYKNPKATEEAWKDGWFHTGDVVREDAYGSVYFVERKKNLIRRSGENIAAAELENVLIDHSVVANCAITALPDPIREEEVAACVVLNAPAKPGEDTALELVNYCLQRLSYFKVPGYIIFVDALPVTSTQKIQRGELRNLCQNLSTTSQSIDCRHLKKKATQANN
jgi:acyl-CoA synthetase (AMP-forming)/AMP-acid ligase II